MIDVFLSRPTYIPKKQKKGINDFCTLLKTMDLNPRTLGTTEKPVSAPLNEVLNILNECSGMIVLGISQICVKAGTLKEKKIKGLLKLATEWNQIEAALAYSKKKPLLIIHDEGISRGIFDRGALAGYIYDVNFNNENWYANEDIMGALQSWKRQLTKKKKIRKQAP